MNIKFCFCVFAFCVISNIYGQLEPGALMGIPNVSNADMIISGAAQGIQAGTLVYNQDIGSLYQFDGTNWIRLAEEIRKTIVLNRSAGGNNTLLPNATNTYFDFPLDASHTQVNTGGVFTVVGNGRIQISEAGTYLMSAELSTNNMPAGDTKYIIGAFRNGILIGYLTRGFASLPNQDWWGGTGVLMYNLNANDIIGFRYVLNNNGNALSARFLNIGMTKI